MSNASLSSYSSSNGIIIILEQSFEIFPVFLCYFWEVCGHGKKVTPHATCQARSQNRQLQIQLELLKMR